MIVLANLVAFLPKPDPHSRFTTPSSMSRVTSAFCGSATLLSVTATEALDVVGQWMEINYPPEIPRFNRPNIENPAARRLVCRAHWPLTSPPLHNSPGVLAGLIQDLRTMRRARRTLLSVSDKAQISDLERRQSGKEKSDDVDREQAKIERHRREFCGDFTTYEDAVEFHQACQEAQDRLLREYEEARFDTQAAMAHVTHMKKLVRQSVA